MDFKDFPERFAHAQRQAAYHFGRRIAQSDVAKAIGYTRGLMSQWESGKKTPTAEGYLLLGLMLGVDSEWLRTGAGAGVFSARQDVISYWKGKGRNPAIPEGEAEPSVRALVPKPYYGEEPKQTKPVRKSGSAKGKRGRKAG